MDQQQFKIRMSVSTKLLVTISLLLTTPIFFLNVSAISLFRADKKAYVYDSQATSAILAGREFVSFLDNAQDILKLMIGTVDLNAELSPQSKNSLQFYLGNQHSLVGAELYSFNPANRSFKALYGQFEPKALSNLGLSPDKIHLDVKALEEDHLNQLQQRGFFFKSLSKPGQSPLLAVILANPSLLKERKPTPLAIGYVGLQHFLSGLMNSSNSFMIADKEGRVLFTSDLKALDEGAAIAENPFFKDAWSTATNSGAKEYVSPNKTRMLGSFYKPGLDLIAISQIEYEKAMLATYVLTEKFIVLGIAALGVMIVLGLLFSKQLTAPLHRLFKATAQVSRGNFNVKLPISSHDEIGALTNSFVTMSQKISELVQEIVDKVRIDQELAIAQTVQQSLFPQTHIKNEHLQVISHYQSASECGGDWWGYFNVGARHILAIADATGHGLPSALMTASARSCFSVIEKLARDSRFDLDPGEILSIANRVVYDSAQGKIMMTCFVCVLDFDSRKLAYAGAAHNPPWLFRKKDGHIQASSLVTRGQRLGEDPNTSASYEVKESSFEPGDTLVLYTDGLLEGKNTGGVPYGKKQARAVLEETIKSDPGAAIDVLMSDFMAYNAGKALDDDVTLAVARVLS